MRIDIHTHFMSINFVKHLQGRDALPKTVLDGGYYIVQCAPGFNLPMVSRILDMEEKLRDMDEMRIDRAILSHGLPGPDVLGGRDADEWAMRINDELAAITHQFPDKFIGWGCLGFGETQNTIAEVDRCIDLLGFKGIQILSHIRDHLLDAPEFRPVLAHIGRRGVPINLHPTIPLHPTGIDSPGLMLPLGFLYDSSVNVVRLIQSGLFDEVPSLKLIVPHVGAVLPYLKGRVEVYNRPSLQFSEASSLKHSLGYYLSNLYIDTVCYHKEALECSYKVMGADHLLYGTDHPYGDYRLAAQLVETLNCSETEQELIYHGNIERLLNLQ